MSMRAAPVPLRVLALMAAALAAVLPAQPGRNTPTGPLQGIPPEDGAREFYEAWKDRDVETIRKYGHADPQCDPPEPDPFLVAWELFRIHARAAIEDPPRADDHFAAAEALAKEASKWAYCELLPVLVRRWRSYESEDLRRELRLGDALERVQGLMAEKQGGEAVTAVDASAPDLEESRFSVAAVLLNYEQGRVLHALGRPREAETAMREGAGRAEACGWRFKELSCWYYVIEACKEAGDLRPILEIHRKGLALVTRMQHKYGIANIHQNIGEFHLDVGEFPDAVKQLQRAIALWEDLAYTHYARDARVRIARSWLGQGRLERAAELFERALEEETPFGEAVSHGDALRGLALARFRLGRPVEALDLLEEARVAHLAAGKAMRSPAAEDLVALGDAWFTLGDGLRAADAWQRAVAEYDAIPNVAGATEGRTRLADLRLSAGEEEQALKIFAEALAAQDAAGVRGAAAATRRRLAAIHRRLGRAEEAQRLLQAALKDCEERGDRRGAVAARRELGLVFVDRSKPEEARTTLKTAADDAGDLGDRDELAATLAASAEVEARLGAKAEAGDLARRALDLWATFGRGFGDVGGLGVRERIRTIADLGFRMALDRTAAADAWWFTESGRALLLAEEVLNRDALVSARLPPNLADGLLSAQGRMSRARSRVIALESLKHVDARALAGAQTELEAAGKEMEIARARVERESRRVAQVIYPSPDLGAAQALLEPGATLALYHLDDARAGVVLATRDEVRVLDLGAAADVRDQVERWLALAQRSGSDDAPLAAELHDRLVRPVAEALPGTRRLIVSPDGALSFLPFEALVRKDGESATRLLESWEIAYVPSGTVYAALRREAEDRPPGEGLVALGDPVYPGESEGADRATVALRDAGLRGFGDLPRLPETAAEVKAIEDLYDPETATTFLRGEATLAGLKAAFAKPRTRVQALHLACHGWFDRNRPRLSGLVLSGGEMLTLDDLYRLDLGADLAVLSACTSGRGDIRRGEGVIGLVRGFLFAGCSRVVVSNWKVQDDSTRDLMVSFYRNLRQENLSPAAALRSAKLAFLRTPRAHPFHWAAFVLWGF